ncbi:MAG: Ig-like domain-containing protein [bacterium]
METSVDHRDGIAASAVRRATHLAWRLAVSAIVVVAGCGGDTSTGSTAGVAATPVLTVVNVVVAPDSIIVGERAQAGAAGLDQAGVGFRIGVPVWSTTSPGIATVSATGVVDAIAVGQTTLVATVDGKQGQRTVDVIPPPIVRISIDPAPFRMMRGTTRQIVATGFDARARELSGRTFTFTSSDEATATVSAAGLVTALAPGMVTIVATGERITAASALTVTTTPDSVATVTLSPGVKSLTVGGTVQLTATLRDSTDNVLAARPVEWLATGVTGGTAATVSPTGLVTALSPGTVIVEAFSEGQHGTATIIIGDNVDESIVITFASPVENELVGDTLHVILGVHSALPLAEVTASVGSRRTVLVLTKVGGLGGAVLWAGAIDITDLPSGPYQVLGSATDVSGARGVGSRQFQRSTRVGKGGSSDQPKQK